MVDAALDSGAAAERFARMVAALGGPADLLEAPGRHLARAAVARPVFPDHDGVVAAVDARAIGIAVVALGGGRARASDTIDHAVGFTEMAGLGEAVGSHRPLAVVHARSAADAEAAGAALRAAVTVADAAPPSGNLIARRFGGVA